VRRCLAGVAGVAVIRAFTLTGPPFWSQRGDGPWILYRYLQGSLTCFGIAYRDKSRWYWQPGSVDWVDTDRTKSIGPFKSLSAAKVKAQEVLS